MLNFCNTISYINLLIKLHWFFFLVFAKKSLIILRIKNLKFRFGIAKLYYMWVLFQNVKTEYNILNVISIISTPLFLIAQSKIKYLFFPKHQQVIGTNGKIYKKFWALFLYIQVSWINQPVYVWIIEPTGWELCTR